MAKSGKYSVEIGGLETHEESQVDRFRRVAQELGCDESEGAFDQKLKAIAQHKPKSTAKSDKED